MLHESASLDDKHNASSAPVMTGAIILSVILFLLNTRHGIGIEPDTVRYMRLGPDPYDAPLYTWVLDLIDRLNIESSVGAKFFALLLVVANCVMIVRTLKLVAGKISYVAAGTALIILAPQFVGFHAVAMSDAVFIFLLLLIVLTFAAYLETSRRHLLVACGVVLGLAMLARFTAAPMAIALAICLLFFSPSDRQRRVVDVMWLAVVSSAVFGAWAIGSLLSRGQVVGRELAFHGNADAERWMAALGTLTAFLLPTQVPMVLRAIMLIAILTFIGWKMTTHARSIRARIDESLPLGNATIALVWALFAAVSLPFMALAMSIEANLTFNARYALPIYIALVIAGCSAAVRYAGPASPLLLGWALAGLAVLVVSGHLVRTAARTRVNYVNGIGYDSLAWRTSPTVAAVERLPEKAVIFTNGPDALNYLTGRKTLYVPKKVHSRTGKEDPNYRVKDVLARMSELKSSGNLYVVFLDQVDWRFYLISEAEVTRTLDLKLAFSAPDGRIYASRAELLSQSRQSSGAHSAAIK